MDFHFARQALHLVTWTCTLRGMRGTYGTGVVLVTRLGAACRRRLCVAGVALADMDLHFAWQAWHLVTWTCTLRGRRGTYGTGLVLVTRWGAAGLRLVAAHFAWQVWHLVTWTCTLRGRRGAYGTGLVLVHTNCGCLQHCIIQIVDSCCGDVSCRFSLSWNVALLCAS